MLIIFVAWAVVKIKAAKKPVPQKPMATRKPKCETDEFEEVLKDFSVEDWEELEALNNE